MTYLKPYKGQENNPLMNKVDLFTRNAEWDSTFQGW